MTKQYLKNITIGIFALTLGGIAALALLPKDFFAQKDSGLQQARVIVPQSAGSGGDPAGGGTERLNLEDGGSAARISFTENEQILSILTSDFDGDSREEQIIAYRNLKEYDSFITIAYVDTDPSSGDYFQAWTAPSAATQPNSLLLYSEDLAGDGGVCILVSGMNGAGKQTLTVFRKTGLAVPSFSSEQNPPGEPFVKIAEFIIEGSIAVQEIQGAPAGGRRESLTISTYGRDYASANVLDQIETTYTYNKINGLYEQSAMVKVLGQEIEQNRVSELLNTPGNFEGFIEGLWCRTRENGERQYLYFSPSREEMIFYFDNKEEVYKWQEANPTRYGLHIIGRNNSNMVKTRCTANIELESLESIRIKVFQDVYLRSGPSVVWDGSYRKIQALESAFGEKKAQPYLEGSFKNQGGGITFNRDGSYELFGPQMNVLHRGKYVFFAMGEFLMLELRPVETDKVFRETLKVQNLETGAITLVRVRIGVRGVQELEMPLFLTKS